LSERYISPNGDGVQDATVFFFSLGAPDTVVVEVTAADGGAVVRSYSGPELAGITEGSFE
ncbi:MAG: hypothetical protein GWO04_39715, partial [Actinobacteria bacterium]|nr:hypothetical protein [Actinomycetota bacterium]NIS35694.1 hypothetical protein [Actinomycetota bacterium]